MIYAVSNRTREHIRVPYALDGDAEWSYLEAGVYGWMPWKGGCPLPEGSLCDVRLRHKIVPNVIAHEHADWKGVTHYRPILDQRPCFDCGSPLTAEERYYLKVQCNECAAKEVHQEPEPPAWDGSGLPPVGARVEVEDGCKGTVLAAANLKRQGARAWLELDDGDQRIPSVECIRPIRSEEERAKEAIAGEVLSAMDNGLGSCFKDVQIAAVVYAAIRDGKVPGVKLAEDGEDDNG